MPEDRETNEQDSECDPEERVILTEPPVPKKDEDDRKHRGASGEKEDLKAVQRCSLGRSNPVERGFCDKSNRDAESQIEERGLTALPLQTALSPSDLTLGSRRDRDS